MSSAYFTSILDWIKGWARENTERIEKACVVNGGWEEWAQTELAIYIDNLDGNRVFRERYPYDRPDLRIHSPLGSALVGLKCHQFGSEETVHDRIFVESMWEDVEKVISMDGSLKDCPFVVVGLIRGRESKDRVQDLLQLRVKNDQRWMAWPVVAGIDIWVLALQVYKGVC